MCISQLCYNIFYICIRIRLSKVAFVIQAKRIRCDSVFRRSSLQSPGQVESPYGNCCTHITRLRFLVELTQTELLTEVMQKFGQDFCPGLTPSSHQALAATCSFPHQRDRREKWKGESWTTRGLREGQFNRESRSCAHKQRKPRKLFCLPAGRQVFSTSRRAGPQYG